MKKLKINIESDDLTYKDIKALAKQTGLPAGTLDHRYRTQKLRGKKLIAPSGRQGRERVFGGKTFRQWIDHWGIVVDPGSMSKFVFSREKKGIEESEILRQFKAHYGSY